MTTDYFEPHIGGGVEVVVAEVARRLVARGHDVRIVTLRTRGGAVREMRGGCEVVRYPCIQLTNLVGLQLSLSTAFHRGIAGEIADFGPDIVNPHNRFFTTTPSTLAACRRVSAPTATTLHLGAVEALRGWKGSLARVYEKRAVHRVAADSDRLIAVSEAVGRHFERLAPDPVPPIDFVANGVDVEVFSPRPHRPATDSVTGIFVGRLVPNKGPQILLRALHLVSPEIRPRILVVGEGPLRPKLEAFARAKNLTRDVEFLGSRSDVPDLMRRADFFVRPSTLEGMPLTILEAMASGLPVVATRVAGVGEVVVEGDTGILVAPSDVGALHAAMARISSDRGLRVTMGKAARRRAEALFSWDTTAERTLAAFQRTLGQIP